MTDLGTADTEPVEHRGGEQSMRAIAALASTIA